MPNSFELPSSLTKEYKLFALRTRLIPKLQAKLGRTIDIVFNNYPSRTLHLTYPGRDIYLSSDMYNEIKDFISTLTSGKLQNYCLLLHPNMKGLDIPSSWLRTMIPFLPGLLVDDSLYINLEGSLEYKSEYSEILNSLIEVLKNKYRDGYIVNPTKDMIKDWKLVQTTFDVEFKPKLETGFMIVDLNSASSEKLGLYKPDGWNVEEIQLSSFFHELKHATNVKVGVHVGTNMVDYHYISSEVFGGNFSFFFEDSKVYFTPKNADDLISKIDKINEILHGQKFYGKVLCLYASRLSWVRLYALISQRTIPGKYTVYVRRDSKPLFVFSVKVPIDTNLDEIEYEMRLRSHRLLLFLNEKLGGDVHMALDNAVKFPTELDLPADFLPQALSRESLREHGILF